MAEEEENLLTTFQQIAEEAKKTRESIDNLTTKLDTTANTTLTILSDIAYAYYLELQEMKKLLQWYAEKQTGRKYT